MKGNYSYQPYHKNVNPNHPGFKTRPPHDVFPEDIQCVFPAENGRGAIYLGNLQAAQSLQTLKKLKIKSLLTSCKNIYIRHPKQHVPYSLYIPGEDHEHYDLSVHFETAINFIHQSRKQTNILVHCMAGISRSATLVIAYLIKFYKMSFSQSLSMIRQKRNKVNPNPGFVRLLKKWQQNHLQSDKKRQRSSQQKGQGDKCDKQSYSKSKYDGLFTSSKIPLAIKKGQNYQYGYLAQKYEANKGYKTIEHSNYKKYNPQNDYTYYKNTHFDVDSDLKHNLFNNSTMNGNRIPLQSRLKEALGNITNSKIVQNKNLTRDRSLDVLGKDLDDRIAKIKQKYYEASNMGMSKIQNNFEKVYLRNRQLSSLEDHKRLNNTYQRPFDQRKLYNNYIGDNYNLARSRGNRQSLRNSIYNPSYNVNRTIPYQYN